jgi:hypothetical protein
MRKNDYYLAHKSTEGRLWNAWNLVHVDQFGLMTPDIKRLLGTTAAETNGD